jgi:hypothetical protein
MNIILALAKQQAENLAAKCDDLADTVEALAVMLETYNKELKKVKGAEKVGSVERKNAGEMSQTKRGSKRSNKMC